MSIKDTVVEILNSLDENVHQNIIDEYDLGCDTLKICFPDYEIKNVDFYGGEGQGEDFYTVYSFFNESTQEVVYIKWEGYYTSYDGVHFEWWKVVYPTEVLVTKYV